eukprot:TRINITY_DN7901_c0_g1_i2.p1 TRINITY_DN7901_c0_g1~~TRINITY_DN7901_c0_g1_i2.p1  ORF type:complete len:164 (+),score=12.12 TRINITY_DN7901_c0_g1_i2:269-760(+)
MCPLNWNFSRAPPVVSEGDKVTLPDGKSKGSIVSIHPEVVKISLTNAPIGSSISPTLLPYPLRLFRLLPTLRLPSSRGYSLQCPLMPATQCRQSRRKKKSRFLYSTLVATIPLPKNSPPPVVVVDSFPMDFSSPLPSLPNPVLSFRILAAAHYTVWDYNKGDI